MKESVQGYYKVLGVVFATLFFIAKTILKMLLKVLYKYIEIC